MNSRRFMVSHPGPCQLPKWYPSSRPMSLRLRSLPAGFIVPCLATCTRADFQPEDAMAKDAHVNLLLWCARERESLNQQLEALKAGRLQILEMDEAGLHDPAALSHDLPPTLPSWTRSSLNMTHPETAKLDANTSGPSGSRMICRGMPASWSPTRQGKLPTPSQRLGSGP
jgi:hypothetical protein